MRSAGPCQPSAGFIRPTADALLSDDFTFASPYDGGIDKAAFFERCWPNSKRITSHVVEKVAEDGAVFFGATYREGALVTS